MAALKFLADESCDFVVVRALRQTGHDVVAIVELAPQSDDERVIHQGFDQNRITLTEDKDFGWWIYARSKMTAGVVFIRYPAGARSTLPNDVLKLVAQYGDQLPGNFIVLSPGRVRISRPRRPTNGN